MIVVRYQCAGNVLLCQGRRRRSGDRARPTIVRRGRPCARGARRAPHGRSHGARARAQRSARRPFLVHRRASAPRPGRPSFAGSVKSPGTTLRASRPSPYLLGARASRRPPVLASRRWGRVATHWPYGDGRPPPADAGVDETSALPVGPANFSQTLPSFGGRAFYYQNHYRMERGGVKEHTRRTGHRARPRPPRPAATQT